MALRIAACRAQYRELQCPLLPVVGETGCQLGYCWTDTIRKKKIKNLHNQKNTFLKKGFALFQWKIIIICQISRSEPSNKLKTYDSRETRSPLKCSIGLAANNYSTVPKRPPHEAEEMCVWNIETESV